MVNQLSDNLDTCETTPKLERQLILDSHIRACIRDEIELLKKEKNVRCVIEHVPCGERKFGPREINIDQWRARVMGQIALFY